MSDIHPRALSQPLLSNGGLIKTNSSYGVSFSWCYLSPFTLLFSYRFLLFLSGSRIVTSAASPFITGLRTLIHIHLIICIIYEQTKSLTFLFLHNIPFSSSIPVLKVITQDHLHLSFTLFHQASARRSIVIFDLLLKLCLSFHHSTIEWFIFVCVSVLTKTHSRPVLPTRLKAKEKRNKS